MDEMSSGEILRTDFAETRKPAAEGNRGWIGRAVAVLLACSSLAFAEPPSRLHGDLRNGQTFELNGNVHPRVATSADLGTAPTSLPLERIILHLQRSAPQQQQLERLLEEQQNEHSSQFHHWLTPEQFAERFGASKSDIAKISAWLKEEGFSNVQVARSRTAISASGDASLAQSAFQTSIHRFRDVNAVRYANTTAPVLPAALHGFVSSISGLNDFHPRSHMVSHEHPHFTSSISGNHFLVPGDFATIYDLNSLYSQGINGTGQKIAIVGETDINLTQVATFRSNAGLSVNAPQVILDGIDPGIVADEQIEAYLDVEWSGAVAPNATILYVNSTDVFESLRYAVDNNLAPVVSVTYGLCEAQQGDTTTLNALFQQANSQGITVIAASGDTGAADCDSPSSSTQTVTTATQGLAVDFPASSPFVTGVGGTEFSEGNGSYWAATNTTNQASALSYIPEVAWNDTVGAAELSATGGGASALFAKPAWQVGTGVPTDGARDVPDIALNASILHDEYLVCGSDGTTVINNQRQVQDCTSGFRDLNSNLDAVGGTSTGSPSFAGVMALLNQQYGGSQGNINPRLYSLAATSIDAFHDIATGNNQVPCTLGTPNCPVAGELGFTAGTGYDQTTGLGSIDGTNFVQEWAPGFTLSASPTSLTVPANSKGTAAVVVSALGGFTGSVTLTCSVSGALTNTTCSIPTGLTGGGTVTLTINRGAAASVFPPLRWTPPTGGPNLPMLVVGLLLLSIALTLLNRRGKRLFAPALAVLGFAVLAACGGGGSSSAPVTNAIPVTASVTVTATSGSTTHTTTVAVTED